MLEDSERTDVQGLCDVREVKRQLEQVDVGVHGVLQHRQQCHADRLYLFASLSKHHLMLELSRVDTATCEHRTSSADVNTQHAVI